MTEERQAYPFATAKDTNSPAPVQEDHKFLLHGSLVASTLEAPRGERKCIALCLVYETETKVCELWNETRTKETKKDPEQLVFVNLGVGDCSL